MILHKLQLESLEGFVVLKLTKCNYIREGTPIYYSICMSQETEVNFVIKRASN